MTRPRRDPDDFRCPGCDTPHATAARGFCARCLAEPPGVEPPDARETDAVFDELPDPIDEVAWC